MYVCVRVYLWTNLVTYEAGLYGKQLHAEAHSGDGHGSRGNDRSAPGNVTHKNNRTAHTINTFLITLPNPKQQARPAPSTGRRITNDTTVSHPRSMLFGDIPLPSPRRFRTCLRPRCGFSAWRRTCCPPNAPCREPAWTPTAVAHRRTCGVTSSSAHHVQQSSAEQFFWSMYAKHLLTGLGGTGPGAGATSSNSSAKASNECFWCGELAPSAAPRSAAASRSWRVCCMLTDQPHFSSKIS
jgi:hypothetical protein